ncbi:MAG: hypothetical protein ACKVSF_01525 [Alphaproteobacteria bacterium]
MKIYHHKPCRHASRRLVLVLLVLLPLPFALAAPARAQQGGWAEVKVHNQTFMPMHVACIAFGEAEEGWIAAMPGSQAVCVGLAPVRAVVRIRLAENAGWRSACAAIAQPDWRVEMAVAGQSALYLRCRRTLEPMFEHR